MFYELCVRRIFAEFHGNRIVIEYICSKRLMLQIMKSLKYLAIFLALSIIPSVTLANAFSLDVSKADGECLPVIITNQSTDLHRSGFLELEAYYCNGYLYVNSYSGRLVLINVINLVNGNTMTVSLDSSQCFSSIDISALGLYGKFYIEFLYENSGMYIGTFSI